MLVHNSTTNGCKINTRTQNNKIIKQSIRHTKTKIKKSQKKYFRQKNTHIHTLNKKITLMEYWTLLLNMVKCSKACYLMGESYLPKQSKVMLRENCFNY